MTRLTIALLVAAAAGAFAAPDAEAQQIGPPIAADQVIRQQAQPLPGPPSPPVSAGSSPSSGAVTRPLPRAAAPTDRVARCQHQAALERVPRNERASYVHNCVGD